MATTSLNHMLNEPSTKEPLESGEFIVVDSDETEHGFYLTLKDKQEQTWSATSYTAFEKELACFHQYDQFTWIKLEDSQLWNYILYFREKKNGDYFKLAAFRGNSKGSNVLVQTTLSKYNQGRKKYEWHPLKELEEISELFKNQVKKQLVEFKDIRLKVLFDEIIIK
jgi:hypothetical protein